MSEAAGPPTCSICGHKTRRWKPLGKLQILCCLPCLHKDRRDGYSGMKYGHGPDWSADDDPSEHNAVRALESEGENDA